MGVLDEEGEEPKNKEINEKALGPMEEICKSTMCKFIAYQYLPAKMCFQTWCSQYLIYCDKAL
eukprot:11143986-Ditylum_brightwellii.AAC.1